MIREVYEALREAGASDEKAAKAAEAVALYEPRLADIRNDIAELRTDLQREIAELRAEIKLQRWMLGVNTALVLGVLVKLFVG
jgi:MoxR-like ATPase